MTLPRRFFLITGAAAVATGMNAKAHHGLMIWDRENPIKLEGLISEEMDGFPHWEVEIRVDGQDWVIDLGSDFDLERAGLNPDGREFTIGAKIAVEGYRPKNSNTRLIRPKKITLGTKTFEFTTDWD